MDCEYHRVVLNKLVSEGIWQLDLSARVNQKIVLNRAEIPAKLVRKEVAYLHFRVNDVFEGMGVGLGAFYIDIYSLKFNAFQVNQMEDKTIL